MLCTTDLFFNAKKDNYRAILEVLDTYERVFDQVINFEKSRLYFSGNVSNATKLEAKNFMIIRRDLDSDAHLGSPMVL